jgi:hypothetical protein
MTRSSCLSRSTSSVVPAYVAERRKRTLWRSAKGRKRPFACSLRSVLNTRTAYNPWLPNFGLEGGLTSSSDQSVLNFERIDPGDARPFRTSWSSTVLTRRVQPE